MDLSSLSRPVGLTKARRVGRGGKRGKTSGRGGKGQTARAGNKRRPEWRDIIKRMPKRRGFGKNRSRTVRPMTPIATITLDALEKHYASGETVTVKSLIEKGLVRRVSGGVPPMKILARGTLTKKLIIPKGIALSKEAQAKITGA
ncbi:MAG: uL15 family ribosomal protein [Candidatus Pacebacteria bacterium]|jgi:large subunit ribosomal protein L15|nr:uL15 family ribosomal protein [Candidatus Paceibacterota bacterium]